MFSMTSLESQNSPIRTLQTFYQTKNRPHSRSIKKAFHNLMKHSQLQQLYNPIPNKQKLQLSTKKYVDVLQKNKTLQRRPLSKTQIYSYISFKRSQNAQSYNNSILSKDQSLSSFKLSSSCSRTSSLCSILDKKHKNSFKNQWKQFDFKNTVRQQQVKDRLKFTFYNNKEKNSKIMDKYWKDQSLDDRATNMYQNVFNRTIAQDSLMQLLSKMDKRRRKGDNV